MGFAPLLMIGGSALAGFIGSKLGSKKKKPGDVATPQVEPRQASTETPAPPVPAPEAQSAATATAKQSGLKQRRRAAAGQGFRTNPRRGAAQGAITPAVTPLMLIGGSA